VIRIKGRVEYRDGRLEDFTAGAAARAEWELYAHRHGLAADDAPILSLLVVACYVLNGTLEGFEGWRAGVVDVEAELVEGAAAVAVPPTLREASGE
jgi:hypothetical protein